MSALLCILGAATATAIVAWVYQRKDRHNARAALLAIVYCRPGLDCIEISLRVPYLSTTVYQRLAELEGMGLLRSELDKNTRAFWPTEAGIEHAKGAA